MKEKILTVVLGMHRSGTSVIARSLHVLGGDTGDNLVEPWIDNPKGYWEDKDVVDLDNEMLEALGMDWRHLRRLSNEDVVFLERAGFGGRATELIDSRVDTFSSFVVKDPRMAGLIKFWQGVLGRGNYRTDFILAIRNPYSVVKSLVRRNEMPSVQAVLLWLGHVLELLSESTGSTRVIIDYDRLLGNPEKELRRVADELGRDIDEDELSVFRNEFIDVNLRHEIVMDEPADEADDMFRLADDVYHTLLSSLDQRRSLDGAWFLQKLERWEQEFQLFLNILEALDSLQNNLVKQSARIEALEDQLRYSNKDLEYAQNLVYKRDAELKEEAEKRLESEERILQLEAYFQKEKEEYQQYFTKILQSEKEKNRRYTVEHTAEVVSNIYSLAWKREHLFLFPITLLRRIVRYRKYANLRILQRSGLFDVVWYFQENPVAFASGINPIEYYLVHGGVDQRDPHPLFQSKWYLAQLGKKKTRHIPPLLHYLQYGEKAGLQPNPCFDPVWYLKEYPDISDISPLAHYVLYGEKEGRKPCPCFEPHWYREKYLVGPGEGNGGILAHYIYQGEGEGNNPTPLFHTEWYRKEYPEASADGACLLGHYLRLGEKQGYKPNPYFYPRWYAEANPQIEEEQVNLLQHYTNVGEAEGRFPNPIFSPKWYLQQNPDLKDWQGRLLFHYIEWGENEGRFPSPLFSPTWYRQEYGIQENVLPHYIEQGEKKGFKPNPFFDPHWYGERNPDLATVDICLLFHYMQYGEKEGRFPAPHFFPEWYRQRYMREDVDADECALSHFISYGESQRYNPGPFFDSEWYHQTYIGPGLREINPYRHYLTIGQYKGFACAPDSIGQHSVPVAPLYYGDDSVVAELENAVIHLHLLSLTHFPGFLERLCCSDIPVYITVSEEIWNDVENGKVAGILDKDSCKRKTDIRLVPSRGRGVSALLLEYREVFSRVEYIGHFTLDEEMGAEVDEALDLLVGRRGERLSAVSSLFAQDASLVYAVRGVTDERFSTWGESYDTARDILKKYTDLRIEDFLAIDEPENFMFWTKLEVLEKFWDLPFSYHSFPADTTADNNSLTEILQKVFSAMAVASTGRLYRLYLSTDSVQDYRRFEELQDYSDRIEKNDIQVLSYYLPQFHPIPENDEWHGKGFTEWTKVRAARPLFRGHWQQHIPHTDMGYYLLDSPDVLTKQAERMKCAGITGMIFYHYWFTGKLILESPAQMLLAEEDIEMPFCFCWANENWTKRWDGNEQEVLLAQDYSEEDAEAFIRYLIPFFRDRRYIKVDGRPMLHVYRPTAIPQPELYLSVWKRVCEEEGVPAPWVVATLTRGAKDPRDFGMDAGVERVLHDWTDGGVPEMNNCLQMYCKFGGSILNYPDVADFYMQRDEAKEFTYFRAIVPCWDNTARYESSAYVLHNPTPEKFQQWLDKTVNWVRKNLPEDKRFLVINAWNEWAEGNHLEADSTFGYAWLNCVGRSLAGIKFEEEHTLLPVEQIPADLSIEIDFTDDVHNILQGNAGLAERFFSQLRHSTLFDRCTVTTSSFLPGCKIPVSDSASDYILEIQQISIFNRHALENMLMTALRNQGAAVVPDGYGPDIPAVDMAPGGAVDAAAVATAPMLLRPVHWDRKRVFIRPDAFAVLAGELPQPDAPEVTCIIRFHRSDFFTDLDNVFLCLQAMGGCRVQPYIVAQDLDETQKEDLQKLIDSYCWELPARVKFYQSLNGTGDLRSKMMNEALREVTTRYAAFLDADDRLFPHAWSWLVERLQCSGKAIAFARVYKALSNLSEKVICQRIRAFEYGTTYQDFIKNNHSPIHSFLLDLTRLDVQDTIYHDDQKYMEDYFLLLQLVTPDNSDRLGLEENFYIGDYLFRQDQEQTLALTSQKSFEDTLESPEYSKAARLIAAMVKNK